ncbi:permease-like cell division protein FtsX [Porticoccus sp.]|uniref:permease-like cell division protein FtsX n=1 Tax=Porticoccus sp. TaxID=2024853 RepID=UPI003F6A34B5
MSANRWHKQDRSSTPERHVGVDKKMPAREQRRGASGGQVRWSDRLKSYLQHHQQLLTSTSRKLLTEPVQTLMTSLVVAIALGLPAALYLGIVNLEQLGSRVETTAQLTLFLNKSASDETIEQLRQSLSEDADIRSVSYISRQQTLEEFRELSGFGDVLEMLEENPLPAVLLVQPNNRFQGDLVASEALVARLMAMPVVDDVRLDMKWMERLQAILSVGERLAFALALALSLGVLLIVGNTIRLAIENRRDEIIVVKLVGGTDSYVRRPFLYTGVWYGLIGGVLAWILVALALFSLSGLVSRLATLYQSVFELEGLGMVGLLYLMATGALLGLVGAWLAVARHLSSIEPG